MQINHIPANNQSGRYSNYNFKPGALVHRKHPKQKATPSRVPLFAVKCNYEKYCYSLSIRSTLRFTKAVRAEPDSMFCDSRARSKA